MSRLENLNKVIRNLSTTTPAIEAAALVDNDGLMMASSLPQDMEDDTVAAMASALQGIAERIAAELARGDFELVMVKGGNGYIVMTRCGSDAVLVVLTSEAAKLGLIFLDVRRAATDLGKLL